MNMEDKLRYLSKKLGVPIDDPSLLKWAANTERLKNERPRTDSSHSFWVYQRMFMELELYTRHTEFGTMKSDTVVIVSGWNACAAMMEVVLMSKGILSDNGAFVIDEDNGSKSEPMNAADYCIKMAGIIPEECRNFLVLIKTYKTQYDQNPGEQRKTQGKVMAAEFEKTMNYFITWFYKQYINKETLGSSYDDVEYRFKHCVKIHEEEEAVSAGLSDTEIMQNLLNKIEAQTNALADLAEQVDKIDERSERIEFAVKEIDRKLEELTGQITAYQSLLERQIEKADSDQEKDRIIQGYADECAERIVKATNASAEKQALEIERRKLVASIGEQAWNKLEDTSKTFLISAKVMYNHLILLDDQTDYSGVCVLITKAIEVEMTKRFFTRFLNFLDATYRKDYSKYHSALLFNGYKPMKPEKFTMGSIAFAMCYQENKFDDEARKQQNRECLMAYAKKELFPGKPDGEIEDMLKEYAAAIEKIRNDYRNPSAHTDQLHQTDAEKCFNLVLDVEKLLKKMLDSFAK